MRRMFSEKQIESIAKLVSKEEFINSIPELKLVGIELPSGGTLDVSQYAPFTCLNCEGEVETNLDITFANSIKFVIKIDDLGAAVLPKYGNTSSLDAYTYTELGEEGFNVAIIILKNIALVITIDNT